MKKIWIKEYPLANIICGRKTIEGRLDKGFFKKIKENDILFFCSSTKYCKVKITKIDKFSNFNDLLKNNNLHDVLPNIKNLDEGIKKYKKYYSDESVKKFGVLGIHIELIKNNNC